MRMRAAGPSIFALGIALGAVSTGCKEYPTEGDLSVLYARMGAANHSCQPASRRLDEWPDGPGEGAKRPEATNARSREAAISRVLGEHHAKPLALVEETVAIPREVESCAGDAATTDGVVVATGTSGELYALAPALEVVSKQEVRIRGTCNRMPSPPMMPMTANFYPLEKRAASEVKTLATPYRGEDTEDVCDAYVE